MMIITPTFIPTQIITAARKWLGTSFHHQGRVCATTSHQGGCDCIGLIMGVANELNICSRKAPHPLLNTLDCSHYSKLPPASLLQTALQEHFHSIPVETMQIGDVMLLTVNDEARHVGILTPGQYQPFGLIHAYAQARKVVEHDFDDHWETHLMAAYRFHRLTHSGE